jgi:hypothetical protein
MLVAFFGILVQGHNGAGETPDSNGAGGRHGRWLYKDTISYPAGQNFSDDNI